MSVLGSSHYPQSDHEAIGNEGGYDASDTGSEANIHVSQWHTKAEAPKDGDDIRRATGPRRVRFTAT